MATKRKTTVRRVEHYLGPDLEIMPDDLHSYEKQGGWVLEPKFDGMWCMLEVRNPDEGRPHVLKSRDATTGPISGSNLDGFDQLRIPMPEGTVLVGELMAATQAAKVEFEQFGYRRFHAFDIPRIGEKSLVNENLVSRRAVLAYNLGLASGKSPELFERMPLTNYYEFEFRAHYDRMIEVGMEGVVLKKVDSLYETSRSDGKTNEWVRCKKWLTEDYVLMDVAMTPGGVYSDPRPTGVWGLYDSHGNLVPVLKAPAKPASLMTPENFGTLVAEFRGWERFKSGALRHAQFVRVREDKPAHQCRMKG